MTDATATKEQLIIKLEESEAKLKEVERTLRETEQTLHVAINATPETLFMVDTEGTIILANKVVARRLGKTVEELTGSCLFDHFPQEVEQRRQEEFNKVVSTGMPSRFEDPREREFYETYNHPVFDEHGKVSKVVIFSQDITQQKETEDALHKSEEKYRAIFENSLVGIYQITPEGRFLSANPAVAHMHGYESPEELIVSVTDIGTQLYPCPEDRVKALGLTEKEGVLRNFEVKCLRKDGSIVWICLNARSVRDEKGNPLYHEGVSNDITERKRLEEELQFAHVLLSTQQEVAIDGILIVDEHGMILSSNRRFQDMWGIPSEAIEAKVDAPVLQSVADKVKDPEAFIQRVEHLYTHRKDTSRDEIHLKDGRVFDRYSSPMFGSDERYYGRVWFFRDITERKFVEEALKDSEEKYRKLVESINKGICVAQDGMLKFVNPMFMEIFGHSKHDLTAVPFTEFIHPEDRNMVLGRHMRRMAGEEFPTRYEFKIITRDRNIRWVELDSVTIQWEGKRALLAFIGDITDRKKAEEALKESEDRFQRLAENAPDMIYRMSLPDGRYEYASPATTRVTGYTPDELYENPLLVQKRLHPDWIDWFAQKWERLIKEGEIEPFFEWQIIDKSDKTKWLRQTNALVKDDKGHPIFLQGIVTDITSRKEAELKRIDSEAGARAILDAPSEHVMCLVDRDSRILDLNETLGKKVGKTRQELLGTCILDLFPESVAETREMRFDEALKSRQPVRFEDKRHEAWNDITIYPVFDEEGKVLKVAIISHDITNRKLMEEELKKHRDHLEAQVEARTEELKQANAELEVKSSGLEEVNTALKVLLRQREGDRQDLEERFTSNIKELVLPYVEKIKKGHLDAQQRSLVDIMEANLNEVVTPFLHSIKQYNLTVRELLIASLVKEGKTTKQIGEVIGVATSSIDTHRNNIRTKLGLNNQKVNLQSYLRTLT